MNITDLNIFLTIVQTKNISNAANVLFMSPTTISLRLKALEEELGFSLIIRKKGVKSIQLTEKGKSFLPFAKEFLEIWNNALLLRDNPDTHRFSISSNSSLLNIASATYQKFIDKNPGIQLDFRILDSDISYLMVQQKKIDIALVMYPQDLRNVITKKLFTEDLVVAYGSHYNHKQKEILSIHDFPLENQLSLFWNNDFEEWYQKHISHYTSTLIRINSISILTQIFDRQTSWAIVPLSIAKSLKSNGIAAYCPLKENPPARNVYYIYHDNSANTLLLNSYKKLLQETVLSYTDSSDLDSDTL